MIILAANDGQYEFSLDGINYQSSNVFYMVSGGIYTAYMRDMNSCTTAREEFPHIVVPEFITPNGDGRNDSFKIPGLEYFPFSEISIFDRYGMLLKASNGRSFSWQGNFGGKAMPSDDYWFSLEIEGFQTIKGHFTLLR